jgi:hypothetical protein
MVLSVQAGLGNGLSVVGIFAAIFTAGATLVVAAVSVAGDAIEIASSDPETAATLGVLRIGHCFRD